MVFSAFLAVSCRLSKCIAFRWANVLWTAFGVIIPTLYRPSFSPNELTPSMSYFLFVNGMNTSYLQWLSIPINHLDEIRTAHLNIVREHNKSHTILVALSYVSRLYQHGSDCSDPSVMVGYVIYRPDVLNVLQLIYDLIRCVALLSDETIASLGWKKSCILATLCAVYSETLKIVLCLTSFLWFLILPGNLIGPCTYQSGSALFGTK